jgi:hypothetical protein
MKHMNYETRKEQRMSVPPQFMEEITKHKKISLGLLWVKFQETQYGCHVYPGS